MDETIKRGSRAWDKSYSEDQVNALVKEAVEKAVASASLKKKPKAADVYTRLAAVWIIAMWMALNVINGFVITWGLQELILSFDAGFLSTLEFFAITSMGVLLNQAVSATIDGQNSPKV